MFFLSRSLGHVVARPPMLRNMFFTGLSCATFSVLQKPAKSLLKSAQAFTPAKVNLVLALFAVLLSSNVYFAFKYFQNRPEDLPAPRKTQSPSMH